jgi:hypothetical protein
MVAAASVLDRSELINETRMAPLKRGTSCTPATDSKIGIRARDLLGQGHE